ncbi:MAG: terminase large subunit [Niameybacter sp.]
MYTHFFKRIDEEGREHIRLDDNRLYEKKTIVKNGVYYHHSIPEDNLFLAKSYIKTLDEMQEYDPDLYRVARWGRFGINGTRVLPQFEVAKSHEEVMSKVKNIPRSFKFVGFDFGFETSYNAVMRCAVDDKEKILYIYWEYYKNKMTDDKTAKELEKYGLQDELITADCEDPKAIQFYRQSGFKMRGCKKFGGSRLANVRKMKRFKKIICSPECPNCIRELSTLVYKKDNQGVMLCDEFNIDPHTFSALWYALDTYTVADIKEIKRNSVKGA